MPVVTALRACGQNSVEIALDGVAWRAFPTEAVVAAGLRVGVAVDRARARTLRRETKRLEAMRVAVVVLQRSDRPRIDVDQRMARAGVAPAARRRALEALSRAGVVDDDRFAAQRALALAKRGAGDVLIADDLKRRGMASIAVRAALATLEPEARRAGRIVARRGADARTMRYLAQKGFHEETIEALVAELADAEVE